jgi:hypothetical protein
MTAVNQTPYAPAPQMQTAWMPPQQQSAQFTMPMNQLQPTPVAFAQLQGPTPVPTFAAPLNADPAHVPQMAAELPVVQPY